MLYVVEGFAFRIWALRLRVQSLGLELAEQNGTGFVISGNHPDLNFLKTGIRVRKLPKTTLMSTVLLMDKNLACVILSILEHQKS